MRHAAKPAPHATSWIDAHRECERLADETSPRPEEKRLALDLALGHAVHARLGFDSFEEYVDFLFGDPDDDDDEADP